MDLTVFFTLYTIALLVCIACDMLWRLIIASGYYDAQLGEYAKSTLWIASFAYYALFILGLAFFALYPAALRGTLATSLVLGCIFGLVVYGVHNLKNLSALKWPLGVAFVDMGWGAFLGGFVALISVAVYSSLV